MYFYGVNKLLLLLLLLLQTSEVILQKWPCNSGLSLVAGSRLLWLATMVKLNANSSFDNDNSYGRLS